MNGLLNITARIELQVRLRETGEARGVQISSPSVTSYTNINPTLRILYLDPVTYIPLDMETFYIDLKADGGKST